jgi:hypothetical protein
MREIYACGLTEAGGEYKITVGMSFVWCMANTGRAFDDMYMDGLKFSYSILQRICENETR